MKIASCFLQIAILALASFYAQKLVLAKEIVEADKMSVDAAEQLFVRRIAILLNEKCLACHGGNSDDIKGEFDIRSRESMIKGGESGEPSLVAGKPDESPVFLAVLRDHESWSPMPPKEADQLNAAQLTWMKDWIAGGAPWPDPSRAAEIAKAYETAWSAEDGITVETSGGLSPDWTNRRYKRDDLWAYQPVLKPVLDPAGAAAIDRLIEGQMPEGVIAAGNADARTFIRRATFDLTGLPPSPEEIEAFEADSAVDDDAAVSHLIDRLLQSPHYGERMAQHWLDVVRYADSSGFSNDYVRGNAWRYRDYVVRAFNEDKPYTEFIREQIAGDEIDPDDPEKLIATGFLRMGPWELTGMEVPKVARQRFLDDVTNSVGETFLAHSLQCARCHDHKFDPIPTQDYYSVQAVFATTQLAERDTPFLSKENINGFEERRYLELRRVEHTNQLARLDKQLLECAENWFAENGKDPAAWTQAVEAASKQTNNNSRRDFADVFNTARNVLMKQGVGEGDFPPKFVGFTPEDYGNERVARKGLERLRWELDSFEPVSLSVYDGRTPDVNSVFAPIRMPDERMTQGELEATCILPGGDPFSSGARVNPGVLSVLASIQKSEITDQVEGRRKAFAEWVASRENPLTARAIVNRIWAWHFADPIAGNPNNFGSSGKKPTHPELLDWLAATFAEQNGSFKSMHRLIMCSKTYRRSSQHANRKTLDDHDPLGTSYAVFKPRRLSAEELRDAMLAVSGELNRTIGGIPNRPEINSEAGLQPRQVMGTFAAAWTPSPLPHQRHRRSIYALKLRGLVDPAMEVFNSPTSDFSCELRTSSTVTPQVFTLFNSTASYTRALAIAARVLKETTSDAAAIERIFSLTYGRSPDANELEECQIHWREMEKIHQSVLFASTMPPIEIRRDAIEENTGEKFSFNEKLHSNEGFVPDLQFADCDTRTRALADVCLAVLNSNEFIYVY